MVTDAFIVADVNKDPLIGRYMGIFKEFIKAPRVAMLQTQYFCELEDYYLSYDRYIRYIEEHEKELLQRLSIEEAKQKVEVLEYDYLLSNPDLTKITKDYVVFVSDKEGMAVNALRHIAILFDTGKEIKVIYGDEDEIKTGDDRRFFPWFKPQWSPDTLKDYMYLGNLVAFRTDVIKAFILENASDNLAKCCFDNIYDMTLKLTDGLARKDICHIESILYHGTNLKKLYPKGCTNYDLTDEQINEKKVSIVIPSKDNVDILSNCLHSVINLTHGINYEIIIVDNGSNDTNKSRIEELIDTLKHDLADGGYVENAVDKPSITYLYNRAPFNFSRMCNQGAKQADGEYILFLNDDIEAREGRWLLKMMRVATRERAGAVGAKLYYPNTMMIQHVGITNLRLGPVHKLQFKDDRVSYYMDINNGVRNCIAVTGACLLVSKEAFWDVGGFADELEVAFNDVDLCMRLYEAGYYNSVCNNTHLWHHESLSRGADSSTQKLERLQQERELLYIRHPMMYGEDPYYSSFLSTDILDNNYSGIYEYDQMGLESDVSPVPFTKKIHDSWYNECLMIGLEYAGGLNKFLDPLATEDNSILIYGYAYVAGSDNSLFSRSMILRGEKFSYKVPLTNVYRPDLEQNLDPMENASVCGFSVIIDKNELEPDDYYIGILTKCRCSRMRLFSQTNHHICI